MFLSHAVWIFSSLCGIHRLHAANSPFAHGFVSIQVQMGETATQKNFEAHKSNSDCNY